MGVKISVPQDLGKAGRAMFRQITGGLDEGLRFDASRPTGSAGVPTGGPPLGNCRGDRRARLWVQTPRGEMPNPLIAREAMLEKTITGITAGCR